MVRKQLPFHQHHDGLVRIKSLDLASCEIGCYLSFDLKHNCFWKPIAQYQNKQPFGSDKDFPR